MNKVCGNCMMSSWCANRKNRVNAPCSGYVRKLK